MTTSTSVILNKDGNAFSFSNRNKSYYGEKIMQIEDDRSHSRIKIYSKGYVLKSYYSYDGSVNETLINEISFLRTCDHPCIIPLLDVVFTPSSIYMVLPLAKSNLFDAVQKGLSLSEKKRISYQIMTAISYLHSRDIIHRDIKPENILLFENGSSKLADFGTGKYIPISSSHESFCEDVTTASFKSPELIEGRPHGKESDIWALAVTLYFLYTNRLVFFEIIGDTSLLDSQRRFMRNKNKERNILLMKKIPEEAVTIIFAGLTVDLWNRPNISNLLSSSWFDDIRDSVIECKKEKPKSKLNEKMPLKERERENVLFWLLDLVYRIELDSRVFFLASWILDFSFDRSSLRLYGLTSLLIADKMTSFYPLTLDDLMIISKNEFTKEEIIETERRILQRIDFDLVQELLYDRSSSENLIFVVLATIRGISLNKLQLDSIQEEEEFLEWIMNLNDENLEIINRFGGMDIRRIAETRISSGSIKEMIQMDHLVESGLQVEVL